MTNYDVFVYTTFGLDYTVSIEAVTDEGLQAYIDSLFRLRSINFDQGGERITIPTQRIEYIAFTRKDQ